MSTQSELLNSPFPVMLPLQAGETELYERIDTMRSIYYRPYEYFCQKFYVEML